MLGKEEVPTQRVHGLVVRRDAKKVDISLPKTYSKEKIPFRRNQIPTPEISERWPHLRRITNKIHPYQLHIDAEILIRCNCPRALKPRDAILGNGDDPYAIISILLGWGIVGPVHKEHEGSEDLATCNKIIITREIPISTKADHAFIVEKRSKEVINPVAIKKMLEADFSERNVETRDFRKKIEDL